MYKPLANSTLMAMTKKQIIEQLRIAEYNFKVTEATVNKQAKNFKKLLAKERKHAHWTPIVNKNRQKTYACSACKSEVPYDSDNYYTLINYCPKCGARMDDVEK